MRSLCKEAVPLIVDLLIIGGGPAGLNAALLLGRACRSVLLIDEGRPRNAVTRHAHGFLTRDGITPAEFRALGLAQLAAYPSIQVRSGVVTAITGQNGAFQAELADGAQIQSRKLLFTTGMKEVLPPIAGIEAVYGTSAFVCPYCDGWELRDQPLVVIGQDDWAFHMVQTLQGWSRSVTLCTNGPPDWPTERHQELNQHRIPVHEEPITRIESTQGQVRAVLLRDGTEVACRGLFLHPELIPGSPLPQQLGCSLTPAGTVMVEKGGKSTVPGLFVAGDAAHERHQLIAAAAEGAITAIVLNGELLEEEWARAISPS